ncbi:synaptonemal complex central element protein 3 [Xyrichtys novacula]|uniref:Synaptonemal complex central element protein 3 n=1 Tax=Xyrichtys novacula TaxID=13765 RepID=A0AAV1FBA0_XYRNO|nr:synaptonemal complex central element protein 3 [Xyrichtys novacula]
MTDFSSPPEVQRDSTDDITKLNKDLERLIENAEHISVQLTWMSYDMVALRTSPDLESSMQKLAEAFLRCTAAVRGENQPESGEVPDASGTTLNYEI